MSVWNRLRRRIGDICRSASIIALLSVLCGFPSLVRGEEEDADTPLPSHFVALYTDNNAESSLSFARELAEAGREALAVDLLLPLLEDGEDLYVRDPAGQYRAAREEALRLLTGMSPEALAHYRAHVDPRFLRITGSLERQRDEAVLREAIDRYFLATHGDQAAWLLAGLSMNRGAFRPAIRLLEQILDLYPDSRIPADALYLRLAIARAAVGDLAGAEAAWARVERPTRVLPRGFTMQTFQAELQALHPDSATVPDPLPVWGMPFGAATRDGRHPPLVITPEDPLTFAWMSTIPHKPVSYMGFRHRHSWSAWMESLLQQLRIRDWRPTEQLYFDDKHIYVHSFPYLVAMDRYTGQRVWSQTSPALELPGFFQVGRRFPLPVWQATEARDIWSFASRVDKELLIHGESIYRVENYVNISLQQLSRQIEHRPQDRRGRRAPPRPARSSLVAVNRDTGAVRWRLDAIPAPVVADAPVVPDVPVEGGADDPAPSTDTEEGVEAHLFRFRSAPLPFGELLLLPVEEGDGLSLLAIDAKRGAIRWRRTLCLYSAEGPPPWQAVRLMRSGADVYVATGLGLLFLLDGESGRIHWVRSYPRSDLYTRSEDPAYHRQAARVGTHPDGSMHPAHVGGWEDNALFLDRNRLVLVPSDAEAILGFDATTGALRWTVRQGEDRYVVGTHGHRLYVAGRFHLRCLDMQEGEELWTAVLPRSVGRGTVAGDEVLIPVDGGILVLNGADGTTGDVIPVPGPPGVPVLNLSTDGEHLFVAGLDRVWSFAPMSTYFPRLQARVEAGVAGAVAARGLYLARNDRVEEAVDDLHVAWETFPADHPERQEVSRYLQRHYLARAEETGEASLLEKVQEFSVGEDAAWMRTQVRAAVHLRHGRLAEAVEVYVGYALEDPALQAGASPSEALLHVHPETNMYRRSRRAMATRGLEDLRERFPEDMDEVRGAVAAGRLRVLREGVPDPVGFLTLANLFPETDAGLEARHRAGRMLVREGVPELAQEAYRRCTGSADPRLRMAGTAFMADLSGMWGWERDAAHLWGDLLRFHADGTLPWLGRERSAHALAKEALRELQATTPAAGGIHRPRPQAQGEQEDASAFAAPPDTILWQRDRVLSRVFQSRGRYPSQFRAEHGLLADPDTGHVECVRLRDGERVWGIDVARSEHHARQTGAGKTAPVFLYPPHGDPFQALSQTPESHLLPLRMDEEIQAFGMVTGGFHALRPRYWRYTQTGSRILNLHMRQGVIALQHQNRESNEEWLTVLCSVTGMPLWSRMQLAHASGGILIGGDHILLIGSSGAGGDVRVVEPYRIADGYMEGQVVVDGSETLIAFSDRGLIIDSGDAIRMQPYAIAREGWRFPLPEGMRPSRWELLPISREMTCLFSLEKGLVLMLRLDGTEAWSIRAADGESLASIAFADDGTSVNVKWVRGRAHRLVQYAVDSGEEMAEAAIPDPYYFPLSVAGASPWIPLLRQHPDYRQRAIISDEVAFFDKRNGTIASTIRVPRSMIQGMQREEFYLGQNFWMHMAEGLFIIDTQRGCLVFHAPPATPESPEPPEPADPAEPAEPAEPAQADGADGAEEAEEADGADGAEEAEEVDGADRVGDGQGGASPRRKGSP